MSPYASKTEVPVEKSRAEIERVLNKEGASQTLFGRDGRDAVVAFTLRSRQVRFRVVIPPDEEFEVTPGGKTRKKSAIPAAVAQEERRRWRSLLLQIKAKFEAIASESETFDEAFLPHIMLPDGKTVAEFMVPQIEEAYSSGKMPLRLLGGPS